MNHSAHATSYRAPERPNAAPECQNYDPEKWSVTGRQKRFTQDNVEAAWICKHQCRLINECLKMTMALPGDQRPREMIQAGLYWDEDGRPQNIETVRPFVLALGETVVPQHKPGKDPWRKRPRYHQRRAKRLAKKETTHQ